MAIANRGIVLHQIDRLFREGTLVGLGDSQLLDRYLTRRDEAAFEALLNMHGPMVLALCRRLLHDPCDVEDAFQATFLVLVRKAPAIRDRALLSNWLYGVAFRVATRARSNSLRRRGREMTVANLEAAVDGEAPDCLSIGPALDQELSRLPGKFRAPLVLCYLKGQTHDQAAEELRCPVGTVRSRLARGRDLLKRRLTRRGFAPTAAVLGTGSGLPAQLLTEAVPPSLIAATVEAAFASSTFTTIQAGAVTASVLALTRGVLTSMKFAQLKWIGLAILTTSLSVGGVVAFSRARAQSGRAGGDTASTAVSVADPFQESRPLVTGRLSFDEKPSQTTEERLRALEQKLDQVMGSARLDPGPPLPALAPGTSTLERLETKLEILQSRSGANSRTKSNSGRPTTGTSTPPAAANTASPSTTSTTSTRTADPNINTNDPFQQTGALTQPDLDPRMTVDTTHRSIRELELQLKLALEAYDRIESLYQRHAVSLQEREAARGKVLLTAAILEGLHDELAEQDERFKLEFKRKRAELEQSQARKEVAATVVAFSRIRNVHLNVRTDEADVAKAEAELNVAKAQVQVKQVEKEELELPREQAARRAGRIKQVLALAERAKASGIAAPAAPPGGQAGR